jgi:hypothetical protein
MNTDNPQSESTQSSFLPIFLISLSLIVYFVWQSIMVSQQASSFRAAQDELERRLEVSTPQHRELIAKSQQIQEKFVKLYSDVKALADKNDEDAISIMRQLSNYVKFTPNPPPGTPGVAPTPAPKP